MYRIIDFILSVFSHSLDNSDLDDILILRHSTPNCIVFGEVGKLPLLIKVDKQLITYWFRPSTKVDQTFAYIVYMIVLKLFLRDEYKARWLCRVKCILDNCSLLCIKNNIPLDHES